jgi:PAP2 superfamily
MKYFLVLVCCSVMISNCYSQDSVYKTKFWIDAPIIAGGAALTVIGTNIITNKKPLTLAELAAKSSSDVPSFDKGNVGYYSESADRLSYVPFHISFGLPIVMGLINKNERKKFGQVMVLYGETMVITGALFTFTDGLIERSRPLVYGSDAPTDVKLSNNSQRSFFAGHTAATAAATFFAAKVFQDFNKGSKLVPYVWVGAAAVPAFVGYLRYKAGMHFLSDNIVGYIVGAGVGMLVPQLHKYKFMKHVNVYPTSLQGSTQLGISYSF